MGIASDEKAAAALQPIDPADYMLEPEDGCQQNEEVPREPPEEESSATDSAQQVESVASESVDDNFRDLDEDFSVPSPEKAPAKPDPAEEIAEAVRAAKVAGKPRRPRKAAPARKLPHGGCTGVWMPKAAYEDPRFESLDEIVLYLEINHLDNQDGCTAKNQHFADFLGCNVQTVQDMIRQMTNRGILTCVYPSRTSRVIHIAGGKKNYPRHR